MGVTGWRHISASAGSQAWPYLTFRPDRPDAHGCPVLRRGFPQRLRGCEVAGLMACSGHLGGLLP